MLPLLANSNRSSCRTLSAFDCSSPCSAVRFVIFSSLTLHPSSGFGIGYIVGNPLGARLVSHVGAYHVLILSTFSSGVATVLLPWCSTTAFSVHAFFALRILLGLAQGPFWPATLTILSRVHVNKRSSVTAGMQALGGAGGAA